MRKLLIFLCLMLMACSARAVIVGTDAQSPPYKTIVLWTGHANGATSRTMNTAWFDLLASATALPTAVAGDLIYGNSPGTWARLGTAGIDNKMLHLSASGSTPAWTTTIFADAYAMERLVYADAANSLAATPKTRISAAGLISTSDTLKADGLTASRMVVTDANKKLATNSVTATEAGYVAGTTGTIQTQLNYIYTHASAGGGAWGGITGTLGDQTDLQAALDAKQALDSDLTYLAGFTPAANVKSILNAADYSAIRTLLGLVIGTNVQAYDADLTTYAGITPSANAQSYLGAADYAAMRVLLGLVIGTNVQAYDADLTTYAGITPSANVQTMLGSANNAAILSNIGAQAAGNYAASGANTDITSVLLNQTGLVVKGGDSNALTIKPNETLTAGRTLNLKVNDAARTIDLSGNLTVPSAATVSGTNTGDAPFTSGIFDGVVGSTRGMIPYRGSGGWTGLSPGSAGIPLLAQGAGADPIYAAVDTGGIVNGAVTLAKQANMATGSLVGRNTAGSGAPEVITDIATGITIGGQYIYRAGGTDVPVTDGGTGASTANAGFNNLSPMTTAGDLIYGGTSGAGTRLAAGTSGYFLHAAGAAAPTWQANKVVIAVFHKGNSISVPATGIISRKYIDKACHITGVVMVTDASGSAVVDIGKAAYSAYSTTFGGSICASALPTITSAIKSQDETLTGWTTALAKDDILTFNLNSISTITSLDGAIYGTID